ncbi:Flp family type IVb pilin [Kribbella sp. NBC_01245]|uniref:Flp family type IVb pilin n=1 Tax=Kribbella sp. NBC_01245 TaxID=2903578 RepID=UPI002E2B1A84|nr:Flp family type IVb pilin [Kribbella sp. NBC_01245]
MLKNLQTLLKEARRDERGATMVEYGLMVALIAMIVVPALVILGPAIALLFQNVAGNL